MAEEELWDAIASNDLQKVQRVLCTNEDIDLNALYSPTTDDYCENVATTFLLWACKTASPEVVSALVTVGADVNASAYLVDEEAPNSWRIEHEVGHVTPLIYAVKRRNIELVRRLLQSCQADPDATNGEGRTALHYVVEPMSPAEDWHSLNPSVSKDATGAREDIAVLLLQAGVKLYLADQKGNTPLHMAAANVDVPICKILLSPIGQVSVRTGMQVSPVQNDGGTPLHSTIESGGRDEEIACIVEMLAQKGADLKARKFGLTPLHLAAQNGLLLTVKTLLEAGADAEAKAARTGLTPLDMARHAFKRAVVVYLETGDFPEDTEDKEDTFNNSATDVEPTTLQTTSQEPKEAFKNFATESALQNTSQEPTEGSKPSRISVWTVARPELGETREEFEGRVLFRKNNAVPTADDGTNMSVGPRRPSTDWSMKSVAEDTASEISTLKSVTEEQERSKQREDNAVQPQNFYPSYRKSLTEGSMKSFATETTSSESTLVLGSTKDRDFETKPPGKEDTTMPLGHTQALPFQLAALQNGSTKTESIVSSETHTTERSQHRKKQGKPARLKDKDILSMDEKMDILLQTLGDMHLQMAKMTKRISRLETEKKSEGRKDGEMGNGP